MCEGDFEAFSAMLDEVCSLLSRGAYVPSATNTAMFFRALDRYDVRQVRAAFDAHVADPQRGRYVPVPADLIAQLDGAAAADGRPGVDEAWALAVRCVDEAVTIVWTREMSQAWEIARPVFERGDEIGARFAFRDAYGRLVEAARRARVPATWDVALGFDVEGRTAAITHAIEQGRLTSRRAGDVLLIGGPAPSLEDLASSSAAPEHARAALQRAREQLLVQRTQPGSDAKAKARTAELKDEAAERARRYGAAAEEDQGRTR